MIKAKIQKGGETENKRRGKKDKKTIQLFIWEATKNITP